MKLRKFWAVEVWIRTMAAPSLRSDTEMSPTVEGGFSSDQVSMNGYHLTVQRGPKHHA